jgi:hypothetical protein
MSAVNGGVSVGIAVSTFAEENQLLLLLLLY